MTSDDLFRLAERSHLRLVVEFNPGNSEKHPGRGYTVFIGDSEEPGTREDRLDAAVSAGVLAAFGLVGSLSEQLDAATAAKVE